MSNVNVLLLLSYDQEPAPDEEVATAVDACRAEGHVYFATTRSISSLQPGALVAFYADGQEDYSLLATAAYDGFLSIDEPAGQSILHRDRLYGTKHPMRMRGFARLKNFVLHPGRTPGEQLRGWLADGRPLTRSSLIEPRATASLYFALSPSGEGIDDTTRIRLLEAKCQELDDKYADTRRLWNRDLAWQARQHERAIAELHEEFAKDKEPATAARGKSKFKGGPKRLARMISNVISAGWPNIELLKDSAEVMSSNYDDCMSLMTRLSALNADPLLTKGLRDGKALTNVPRWFEARFGDNLGRLYYRSLGKGRDATVQVLISQKDEQTGRDIPYLRSL